MASQAEPWLCPLIMLLCNAVGLHCAISPASRNYEGIILDTAALASIVRPLWAALGIKNQTHGVFAMFTYYSLHTLIYPENFNGEGLVEKSSILK